MSGFSPNTLIFTISNSSPPPPPREAEAEMKQVHVELEKLSVQEEESKSSLTSVIAQRKLGQGLKAIESSTDTLVAVSQDDNIPTRAEEAFSLEAPPRQVPESRTTTVSQQSEIGNAFLGYFRTKGCY